MIAFYILGLDSNSTLSPYSPAKISLRNSGSQALYLISKMELEQGIGIKNTIKDELKLYKNHQIIHIPTLNQGKIMKTELCGVF